MKAKRKMKLTDTSLLLLITVVVFFAMYIGAILLYPPNIFAKIPKYFYIGSSCAYDIMLYKKSD